MICEKLKLGSGVSFTSSNLIVRSLSSLFTMNFNTAGAYRLGSGKKNPARRTSPCPTHYNEVGTHFKRLYFSDRSCMLIEISNLFKFEEMFLALTSINFYVYFQNTPGAMKPKWNTTISIKRFSHPSIVNSCYTFWFFVCL